MLRSLAGIHDPSGRTSAADRARLAAAVQGDAPAQSFVSGPLTVSWSGPDVPSPPPNLPWCLLDGQLYNLDELAWEAGVKEAGGAEPTLAAVYGRSGEATFERLRGDFVVLLWDRERKRGLLAVDHIGVRCLCFHSAGGRLVFGSEVREVVAALASRPAPNRDLIPYWLNASRLPPGKTLHDNVRRLQSGHLLHLEDDGWQVRRYWEPRFAPPPRVPRDEMVHQIREAVTCAVRRRLREDEPAAITLSGGLDSSSIAGVATQLVEPARRPVGAYSGTFPDHPSADESSLIVETARYYGLPSTRIVVRGGSPLKGGLEYLRAWAVPPGSANVFWWLPMGRRAVDDGVKVFLDGEDGDHLFGSPFFLLADLIRRGRMIAAVRQAHQIPFNQPITRELVLRTLYNSGMKSALPPTVIRAVRAMRKQERYVPSWFSERSATLFLENDDAYSFRRRGVPRWWSYQVEALTRSALTAILFDHSRRRSMLVGMEQRHPFTDVDLIELILRFPPEYAFDPRYTRPLLRDAMKGVVPDAVRLRRSKSFFDAVQVQGLARADLPTIRRLLLAPDARLREYVDVDAVQRELLDKVPGKGTQPDARWNIHVWRLATMECWLRAEEDTSFTNRLLASDELADGRYEFVLTSAEPP